MRKLVINTFMSLDGIMQAPGDSEEGPSGGFTQGWGVPYFDDEMMERMSASAPYELLLGRGTYERDRADVQRLRVRREAPCVEGATASGRACCAHSRPRLT